MRLITAHRSRRMTPMTAAAAVLALAAVIAGLVFVTPARASADDFVITGRGWGHGVGMSQWGAWQAAREGLGFEEILAFYYPGTQLTTMPDPDARVTVRLSANPPTASVVDFVQVDLRPSVTSATLVMREGGGQQTQTLAEGALVNLFRRDGGVRVVTAAGTLGVFDSVELRPGRTSASETGAGRVTVQMRTEGRTYESTEYWGVIRVGPDDEAGRLRVHNIVHIDLYVRGIGEIDPGWARRGGSIYAPEVVKAQAVASRTFALAQDGTLVDGWQDQYYGGYRLEERHPGLAEAAEDTAGLILTHRGAPAFTYFSAHSGGYTNNSAWSSAMPPYIVAQPDPWSLKAPPPGFNRFGPGWNWTFTISRESFSDEVNGEIRDVSTRRTFNIGLVNRVDVVTRDTADSTSHARTLRLTGERGTAVVSAASLRSALGLRSTLILAVAGGRTLAPGEFWDVGPDHLYREEIARMVTAGLMSGHAGGFYRPNGSITRWQFAKIAVNLYNIMHPDAQIPLVDVTTAPYRDVPTRSGVLGDESDWVAAAKNAGLVTGVTDTTFQPYTVLRRDEMAAMTCRAMGWDDEAAALPPETPGFADVEPGSAYWAVATYLREKGVMRGFPCPTGAVGVTFLRAEEPIERQHVAVILGRVLDEAAR